MKYYKLKDEKQNFDSVNKINLLQESIDQVSIIEETETTKIIIK